MAATEEEPRQAEQAKLRTYVILQETSPELFLAVGEMEGRSARVAVKAWVEAALDAGSQDVLEHTLFVAVPSKSWSPVRVNVETQTRLVFE